MNELDVPPYKWFIHSHRDVQDILCSRESVCENSIHSTNAHLAMH